MKPRPYRIKAVLFDFDGTLTRPGTLDFEAIRAALDCPPKMPILEFIDRLPTVRARQEAMARLDHFETKAAAASQPNEGAEALVAWIRQQGLATGIVTRNSRSSVLRGLDNFKSISPADFNLIITRKDPVAVKPSGDGVRLATRKLRAEPHQVLVIGDFLFDCQAGREAGALTVLLDPRDDPRLKDAECDFRIRRLDQAVRIIRGGLPLPAGKLPNDILQSYLQEFHFDDPALLINPGVGEDIAAVDVAGKEVLILKSDPITFATDAIGRYSVLVNANDIATAGARPCWFLTTLMLPVGLTPSDVHQIMSELAQACHQWEITLCGGHTEITDAVSRPVVSGMMAGTLRREELIDKKNMRTGDCVLLTKGVAVEGAAIIARQFADRLRRCGLTQAEIDAGSRFLDQIGIIHEARLAARKQLASAMHDVTEGGLATALEELSTAGGHRISVEMERIPVFEQTRKICEALHLDPMGLIGSGSLLICCRPQHRQSLMQLLESEGIAAAHIGQVMDQGQGIEAVEGGRPVEWSRFEVDEITKLF